MGWLLLGLWSAAAAQTWWRPAPGDHLSWQWQIGTVPAAADLIPVDMYDVDLFDIPAATVAEMKRRNIKVTCYFSAGTYEGWRPDWKTFFPFITGADYQGNEKPFLGKMSGWNERWLDVREIALLQPIMSARLRMARDKGCDAVEPDNMDSYANAAELKAAGLYTAADQIAYNRAVAGWAHAAGLSVALKNDVDQLDSLAGDFDWALNEQCFAFHECGGYRAFLDADKAVVGVEYAGDTAQFCPQARAMGMSWLKKKLDLGAFREACNEDRLAATAAGPAPKARAQAPRDGGSPMCVNSEVTSRACYEGDGRLFETPWKRLRMPRR